MFAGREFRQVTNHCREAIIAQARDARSARDFRAQAQDSVAIFRVVEGDTLDCSREIVHEASINYPVVAAPIIWGISKNS